jgi:hypothetical protein
MDSNKFNGTFSYPLWKGNFLNNTECPLNIQNKYWKSSLSNKQASKTRVAETAKKRKTLSVVNKVNVMKHTESGKKKAHVCWDSVNSATQTIWKDGNKIVNALGWITN